MRRQLLPRGNAAQRDTRSRRNAERPEWCPRRSMSTIRVALSRKGNQGVRYDERVSPRRRASMYWVRSLALSLALATLSR